MNKRLLFFVFILCIFLVPNVNAEMLVSDAGVEYEPTILEKYGNLEGSEKYVSLNVKLKDYSEADSIFSEFSDEEIKNLIISYSSEIDKYSISVEMTEEAFLKLIGNEKVSKVFYGPRYNVASEKGFVFWGLFLLIFLVLLVIVVIFFTVNFKKRRKIK